MQWTIAIEERKEQQGDEWKERRWGPRKVRYDPRIKSTTGHGSIVSHSLCWIGGQNEVEKFCMYIINQTLTLVTHGSGSAKDFRRAVPQDWTKKFEPFCQSNHGSKESTLANHQTSHKIASHGSRLQRLEIIYESISTAKEKLLQGGSSANVF